MKIVSKSVSSCPQLDDNRSWGFLVNCYFTTRINRLTSIFSIFAFQTSFASSTFTSVSEHASYFFLKIHTIVDFARAIYQRHFYIGYLSASRMPEAVPNIEVLLPRGQGVPLTIVRSWVRVSSGSLSTSLQSTQLSTLRLVSIQGVRSRIILTRISYMTVRAPELRYKKG